MIESIVIESLVI